MAKFKTKSEYEAMAVEDSPVEPVAPVNITDDDLLSTAVPSDDDEMPSRESITAEAKTMNAVASAMPAGAVMMTAADIAAIVQAAVAGAQQSNTKGIGQEIADALREYKGVRPKTVAEIGEPKTPFNPMGKKRVLQHDFFQNYFPLNVRMLHDDEVEMLHQLVPGSYGTADFPINVVEKPRKDGGRKRVFIIHPDGKGDKLKAKNYAPNFHQTLVRLVAQAKEQLAERKAAARKFLEDE